MGAEGGREKDISDELKDALQSGQLSDADIEARIAEMKAARAARDFKNQMQSGLNSERRAF